MGYTLLVCTRNNYIYYIVLGLVKAKKYDWKDSNMALFGSDLERQVKSKKHRLLSLVGVVIYNYANHMRLSPPPICTKRLTEKAYKVFISER